MSKAKNEKHNSRYYQTLELLKDKWQPGMGAFDLAKAAFMTRQAIYPYWDDLRRAGYPLRQVRTMTPPKGTKAYDQYMDKAAARLNPGMTNKECARELGMSESFFRTIRPEIEKRGVSLQRRGQKSERFTSARRQKHKSLYELFLAEEDAHTICKLSGYKLATVRWYRTLYNKGGLTEDGRIVGKTECELSGQPEDQADQNASGGRFDRAPLDLFDLPGR